MYVSEKVLKIDQYVVGVFLLAEFLIQRVQTWTNAQLTTVAAKTLATTRSVLTTVSVAVDSDSTTTAEIVSVSCARESSICAQNRESLMSMHSFPSTSVLRGRLKAFLYRRSFPWLVPKRSYNACAVTVVIFGHLNRSFCLLTYWLTYLLFPEHQLTFLGIITVSPVDLFFLRKPLEALEI